MAQQNIGVVSVYCWWSLKIRTARQCVSNKVNIAMSIYQIFCKEYSSLARINCSYGFSYKTVYISQQSNAINCNDKHSRNTVIELSQYCQACPYQPCHVLIKLSHIAPIKTYLQWFGDFFRFQICTEWKGAQISFNWFIRVWKKIYLISSIMCILMTAWYVTQSITPYTYVSTLYILSPTNFMIINRFITTVRLSTQDFTSCLIVWDK